VHVVQQDHGGGGDRADSPRAPADPAPWVDLVLTGLRRLDALAAPG
jgi:hypothetical protein